MFLKILGKHFILVEPKNFKQWNFIITKRSPPQIMIQYPMRSHSLKSFHAGSRLLVDVVSNKTQSLSSKFVDVK